MDWQNRLYSFSSFSPLNGLAIPFAVPERLAAQENISEVGKVATSMGECDQRPTVNNPG
jgi:hypothetical protein